MEPWVRIMADYCADGVWDRDGVGFSADDLPISSALRARLRAWQKRFDLDQEPPDRESFSAEGRDVAECIKRELPDWTVVYFDEAKAVDRGNAERFVFEYEITRPDDPR